MGYRRHLASFSYRDLLYGCCEIAVGGVVEGGRRRLSKVLQEF
jgi:hypothetical protein